LNSQVHLDDDTLAKKMTAGMNYSYLHIAARYAVQMIATITLARILTPRDYGLVAMSSTWITFLSLFLEMGLSWVTVQKKDLSKAELDNLFWMNSIIGLALTAVSMAMTPAISFFYRETELDLLLAVQSISFLFIGLSQQPVSIMRRRLQYKTTNLLEIFTIAVSLVISIILAVAGYGYWSLIVATVAANIIRAATSFLVSGYVPGKFTRGIGNKKLLRMGGYIASGGIFFYFFRNLDDILVGRMLGSIELGLYSRAYFLINTPALLLGGAFAGITIPAISSILRRNKSSSSEDAAWTYRKNLIKACWLLVALSAGISLAPYELVHVIYGEKWSAVAPILQILAIGGIAQPLFIASGWCLLGFSKNREYFVLSVVSSLVMAGLLYLGITVNGSRGVAAAFSAGMVLFFALPAQYWAHRLARISLKKTFHAILPVYATSFGIIIILAVIDRIIAGRDFGVQTVLALKIAAALAVYGFGRWRFRFRHSAA